MRIAVMQPYFYPYVGYFELIQRVDLFVFLTDVQYIRRGWVNRNRLRSFDKPFQYLTVPVQHAPREALIADIELADDGWHGRHLKLLSRLYGQATQDHPLFQAYSALPDRGKLCPLLKSSIRNVCSYLGLATPFEESVGISQSHGVDRIIDICRHFHADTYVNLPGGKGLYQPAEFARHGIALTFSEMTRSTNLFSILDLCLGDGLERL